MNSNPKTKDEICNVLKMFYVEARKTDGTSSCKNSLTSIRFGLCRHYKATYGFDIINDSEFGETNKVFQAKCVELKRQGLAKVKHKSPICKHIKNGTRAMFLIKAAPKPKQLTPVS